MSALKIALVIAGVGVGGVALAHVAGAALNPGSQKVTDPGLLPASTGAAGASPTTVSSTPTITKRQQLQQLQADLSKYQTMLDDAKAKLSNAKGKAGSTCNWIKSQRQWCTVFCDIGTQDRAVTQCERYVTDQSSDTSLIGQSDYYNSTAHTSVNALRKEVQAREADVRKYQSKVKAIQGQIDNLNAQGVY